MMLRDSPYDVSVDVSSEVLRLDAARLRRLFDWVIDAFKKEECLPNTLDAQGAGFDGSKYLDFSRNRRRLERADFAQFTRLGCAYFPKKQNNITIGWDFQALSMAAFSPLSRNERRLDPTGLWYARLCMFPSTIRRTEQACIDVATRFARLVVDEYGYLFFMQRNRGPTAYLLGMNYENELYPHDRTKEEISNIGWSWDKRGGRPILRDVFPANYLGPALQRLPVEGQRFVDWLRADSTRGTVEPFACEREPNIVLWKPTLNRIPELREQLYLAGLVWHYQYYYRHLDRTDPVFLPSEPPPEIMRAEFYADRDPKLTR